MTILHNLTPHEINIHLDDDVIITLQSEGIARAEKYTYVDLSVHHEGHEIPVNTIRFGEPIDLPAYREGHAYIVSALTAQAAYDADQLRPDLFIPGELVRDRAGRVIGCLGLSKL